MNTNKGQCAIALAIFIAVVVVGLAVALPFGEWLGTLSGPHIFTAH